MVSSSHHGHLTTCNHYSILDPVTGALYSFFRNCVIIGRASTTDNDKILKKGVQRPRCWVYFEYLEFEYSELSKVWFILNANAIANLTSHFSFRSDIRK